MSGLVNFVKKTFKKVKEGVKKVFKSKIFKVIAIAAAVVFTGGAALGALAAGTGAGFGAMVTAGFQAGLSALGTVGTAIWGGVQAVGSQIAGFMGAGGGATTAAVPGTNAALAAAEASFASTLVPAAAQTAAPVVAKAGLGQLGKAALVSTAGNMIGGYAQGRAQEQQARDAENNRLDRDRFGFDGRGNPTGELNSVNSQLDQINTQQQPSVAGVGLDQPPAPTVAPVAAPTVPSGSVSTQMRDKLMASLSGAPFTGV